MNANITAVLQDICDNLMASGRAYQDYLANGKTFYYAKELMKYNSAIRVSLAADKAKLPLELQQDAGELLFHYAVWTEKWLELEKEIHPADNDVFIFQNSHTFPRHAARNMEKTLEALKKEE